MSEVKELEKTVKDFCSVRDWDQFHSPKDLAVGISIESAELLELFRFKSEEEVRELMAQLDFKNKVGDELADILFLLLRFSELHEFNLVDCFHKKLKEINIKYSIEKSKGRNQKYTEYNQS